MLSKNIKDIISKIREIRVSKGISQKEMGEAMNSSQQTYNRLEVGDADISLSQLEKIAEKLGLTFQELLSPDTRVVVLTGGTIQNQDGTSVPYLHTNVDMHIKDLQRENTRLWSLIHRLTDEQSLQKTMAQNN